MNNSPQAFERYLALDTLRDKHYVVVGGVNAQQQVIVPPRRLDFGEWAMWLSKHVCANDAVVLETVALLGYALCVGWERW